MIERVALFAIVALIGVVLTVNLLYLLSTPTPNTWIWWAGDETWVMSQYKTAISTGKYIFLFADGTTFTHGSGVLFGSCWLSTLFYGLPSVLLQANPIDIGRAVTFCLGVGLLLSFYYTSIRYGIRPILAASGALLMASSICFFLVSHSCRSDLLIGATNFLLIAYLAKYLESGLTTEKVVRVGFLTGGTLLVSGHVLVDCFLAIGYLLVEAGIVKRFRYLLLLAGVTAGSVGLFLLIQGVTIGSWSLMGPFQGNGGSLPISHFFSPHGQIAIWLGHWFYVKEWATGYVWPSIVVLVGLAFSTFFLRSDRFSFRTRPRWLIASLLVVFATLFLELSLPRYLMYSLPILTLMLMMGVEYLLCHFP